MQKSPMHETTANAYLRTKVMTASPAELRLMLLDGAIRFAGQARDGLASKDFEGAYNGFTQCRAIIMELINGIRPEHEPELSERVRSLYMFLYKELFEASFDKDVPRVEKVIELLEFERETWVMLMDKLAHEGGNGKAPPHPAASGSEASGGPASSLSIQA
jgi:flagellar protein FliS